MTPTPTLAALARVLGLAARNANAAIGNDHQAPLDSPEPAAERAPAESLTRVDSGPLQPGSLTDADIAGVGPTGASCRFRYAEVRLPVRLPPASRGSRTARGAAGDPPRC